MYENTYVGIILIEGVVLMTHRDKLLMKIGFSENKIFIRN